MRPILILLAGIPLLQITSFGEDAGAKAGPKCPTLPAAPHYWDANSWDNGAAITFWRACRKNKSINASTANESMQPAEDRTADRKHSSPTKGG